MPFSSRLGLRLHYELSGGLTAPFLIVGAAAGSAVAVIYAARHPADVSGLIQHDSLRPLDQVRAVAATFPNATVEELDSAHIMSEQAPGELAQRIIQFHDDAIVGRRSPEHH